MEFVYLDESGDPGNPAKPGSSQNLTLALICTRKKEDLSRIIRKTKQQLQNTKKNAKWLNRKGGEIKFYGFPDDSLLRKTLKQIANIPSSVYVINLTKDGKKIDQSAKMFIMQELFVHIRERMSGKAPQKILADLSFFNKEKVVCFCLEEYNILEMAKDDVPKKKLEIKVSLIPEKEIKKQLDAGRLVINVVHHNSRTEEMLQVVDLIAGSYHQQFEKNDKTYARILENGKGLKVVGVKNLRRK